MSEKWLIEFYENPNDPKGCGYISDVHTDDDFSIELTRDPMRAIQFSHESSAQLILDNPAFIHAMAHVLDKFKVRGHIFYE